ncbi:MAG TPA: multiheme c-type cytochrome [Steroidobacteraceae bacterium]|nr:multiheme c-type cytochrome [Steroidobacteraceae bacterium]
MKLPEQVMRLGIVVAAIAALVLLLRFVILPDSFFSARPHQVATVEREMAKPLHHAGVAACRKCHEEEFEDKYAGSHRNIACENCHGPSVAHATDRSAEKPNKPREREFCLACHAYDSSRPNGFPQVDPQEHNPRKRCVVCHDAHDPVPPKAPQECSGCHGRIARTKALSTHALLPCTECHAVDEQHMIDPRSALPTKPSSREVCGRCHAAGSTDPAASKAQVDIDSHGGIYVCWECHYAHLPEGRK